MEWQSSRPREMQEDSHEIFPSPLENPSDSVYPVMDISDFATDNGPFHLEEGQIPPSASTVRKYKKPFYFCCTKSEYKYFFENSYFSIWNIQLKLRKEKKKCK
jgi:hypothetical protein